MQETIIWTTKTVKLANLRPATYNPRKLNARAVPAFESNLTRFGNLEPIVVNQDFTIIGGHMRVDYLDTKGETQVEVSYPSRLLSSDEEKKLNMILNSVSGYTDPTKLLGLGLSVDELHDLGNFDLTMPDEAQPKKKVVLGNAPVQYICYLFSDDFFTVKKTLKEIQKTRNLNQSEAVLWLLRN